MKVEASVGKLILDIYSNILPEEEYTNLKRTDLIFYYSNKLRCNCLVVDFVKLLSKPSTVVVRDYRLFNKDLKQTFNTKVNEWIEELGKNKDFIKIDENYLGVKLTKDYKKYLEAKFIKNVSDYQNYNKLDVDTLYKVLDEGLVKFFPTNKILELQNVIIKQARVFNSDAYWLNILKEEI